MRTTKAHTVNRWPLSRRGLLSVFTLVFGWSSVAQGVSPNDFFKSREQAAMAEAAADGRTQTLDKLLAEGAKVNAQGQDGMTALYWAMGKSSEAGLDWLLQHGADLNVIFTRDGTSAMEVAAIRENPLFLQQVLAHGGDINLRNPISGTTPIFRALAAGRTENVRTLIAAGADMNVVDHLGLTCVAEAAANQRYQLVYEMLVAGADPTVRVGRKQATLLSFIRISKVAPPDPEYPWQLKVIDLLQQKGLDVEHGE
jgi:uncharacterized protein